MELFCTREVDDITSFVGLTKQKKTSFCSRYGIELYLKRDANRRCTIILYARIIPLIEGIKININPIILPGLIIDNTIIGNIFMDGDITTFEVTGPHHRYLVILNLEQKLWTSKVLSIRRRKRLIGLHNNMIYFMENSIIKRINVEFKKNDKFEQFLIYGVDPCNIKLIHIDDENKISLSKRLSPAPAIIGHELGHFMVQRGIKLNPIPIENGIVFYIPAGVQQLRYLPNGYNSSLVNLHLIDKDRNEVKIDTKNQIVGVYSVNDTISIWLHNLTTNIYQEYSYGYRYIHTKNARSIN